MYTVQEPPGRRLWRPATCFWHEYPESSSVFFTLHPALEKDVKRQSPNYWVGYGHFPHSVQDRNINLSIYNIPKKKGMMESALLDYTRAYFPSYDFDTAFIEGPYAFGKLGDIYCAFIGAGAFEWRDEARDDLIQYGKQSFWITEAGSKSKDRSFEEFVSRIRNNPVNFDPQSLSLEYRSNQILYELEYGKNFRVNGKVINTQYPRYNSPYVQGNKKDKTFTFSLNGESLLLDFDNMIRKF